MPLIQPRTPAAETARMGTDEALALLVHGDAVQRRQAALDLAGDETATAALAVHLAGEEAQAVRHAILSALTRSQAPEAVDALVALLRSEEAELRSEAVAALQQMVEPVARRMEALLADADPDIRIMAVDVLRLLPHPDAPVWLRALLLRETHENVVGAAVDRLAEIGGVKDLDALTAVRDRFADVAYIRFATELVIARIRALDDEADG